MPDLKDVKEAVTREIKAIGAESKANYEALQKDLALVRSDFDNKNDLQASDVKEELKKLSEAVSIRQEAMEKSSTKRMDDIEVAMKRSGGSTGDMEEKQVFTEAKQWTASCLLAKNQPVPINMTDEQVDIDGYKSYCSAFIKALKQKIGTLTSDEQRALIVGTDPDGGLTVPTVMLSKIVELSRETTPMRELAMVETISTGALEFQTDMNDIVLGGWVGEQVARPNTGTPQRGMRRIEVHEHYARPSVSQILLDDQAIDNEAWLSKKLSSRFSRTENTAFVTGDGVSKPRGFLTYTSGTTYASGQIEQVNMGHATILTTDGFTKIMYSLVEEFIGKGTWLMQRTTVRDTMLLKDGDGQYIWRPGLQAGQPSVILTLPVRMASDMPTIAANALSVALSDWSQSYMILDRLGITVLRDPYTNVPFVDFYSRKRVGGDVINFQAIKIGKIAA